MDKYLSRKEVQVILDQAPKNIDKGKILQYYINDGYKLEGFNDQQPQIQQPKQNFGEKVATEQTAGVKQIGGAIKELSQPLNPNPLKELAPSFNATMDVVTGAARTVLPQVGIATQGAKNNISASKIISSLPAVVFSSIGRPELAMAYKKLQPDVQSKVNPILEQVKNEIEQNPETARTVGNVLNAVLLGLGSTQTGTVTTGVKQGIAEQTLGGAIKDTAQAVNPIPIVSVKISPKELENSILESYNKGVKPSVSGKTNIGNIEKYNSNVLSAVKTINENIPNISFVDDFGETILGQKPKSLKQLSEAIDQTKKNIFNKYDTLAKQAGDGGVNVDLNPIASELDSVINNKALSITNPKAIEYAKSTKDRILSTGNIDAITAQEVVQNYNKSLEAFYKNPSYDNASQAAIDALLANKIRENLDNGIMKLSGKEYQTLKKQYGALKSIENDVVKASLRDARRNTKGLIDFGDILSGGQVVNGILSLNPSQVASGLTQKGIIEFYKYLNNPNRAIEKMFNLAERLPINTTK